jgi:hypothetical protein
MGAPKFSRSGQTSPLGKRTAPIPGTKVSEETKEILERLAREAELPLMEFIRELLEIRAHGLDTMQRLHADRLEVVSGKVQERFKKGRTAS